MKLKGEGESRSEGAWNRMSKCSGIAQISRNWGRSEWWTGEKLRQREPVSLLCEKSGKMFQLCFFIGFWVGGSLLSRGISIFKFWMWLALAYCLNATVVYCALGPPDLLHFYPVLLWAPESDVGFLLLTSSVLK